MFSCFLNKLKKINKSVRVQENCRFEISYRRTMASSTTMRIVCAASISPRRSETKFKQNSINVAEVESIKTFT